MIQTDSWTFEGSRAEISARWWRDPDVTPTHAVMLVHGYGEHIGRYEHVAAALVANGAVVYGPDYLGHGRSGGERVVVESYDDVLADVVVVHDRIRHDVPDLPVVLIGHSMGGMIGARYAQVHESELVAVVLSGPVIGRFELLEVLLASDDNLDVPIDVAVLSRDDAVGRAYADDPFVWHGPFRRPTVEAMAATVAAIDGAGPLGELPLLWIHGSEDALVPIEGSRYGIERLRGTTFESHEYPGARHEILNETNSAEVLADVTTFINATLARVRAST